MNRILFSIFLILTTFLTYSQEGENSEKYLKLTETETDSIYLKAIEKYTIEIDSFYNKYSQSKHPKQIYIQNENYLPKIPNELNGYEIIKLKSTNIVEYFKGNSSEFYLVIITPLSFEDGRFYIRLTPYYTKINRDNELNLGLSDWTIIYFDLKDGKLTYTETENGGI